MKRLLLALAVFAGLCCNNTISGIPLPEQSKNDLTAPLKLSQKETADTSSWSYFLQHLPEKEGPVLDYRGNPVRYQAKHYTVINYDVGTRDLQQCADALMRLRAEYLAAQKRWDEISFHFVSGEAYSFNSYCNGKTPVPQGVGVVFTSSSPKPKDAASLRKYLDIVFTYASTISLAKELKGADGFEIGTVVITPGSPGHCFIITDKASSDSGEKLYKMVEGYTPAQSIYVLRNTDDPSLGPWHPLKKGPITTASYEFTDYKLKKFE